MGASGVEETESEPENLEAIKKSSDSFCLPPSYLISLPAELAQHAFLSL